MATRGKNEITLTIAGDSSSAEKAMGRVGMAAKTMDDDVRRASKDLNGGFDRAAESADNFDTKSMGAANAINGLLDVGRAWSDESMTMGERSALLAMGFSDIGSGLYNTLIPALAKMPGVMRLVALGQRALNLVMSANPVLLVVAGIAALAAAFALAWKKSETFRNIVQGAFGAVTKAAAGFLRGIANVVGIFNNDWANSIRGAANRVEAWGDTSDESGKRVVKRFESASDKARRLRDRMQQLSDAAAEFRGEARDLDSAVISLEEAIDGATKAARDNGKATDITTRKGRENRRALIDLGGTHDDLIQTMKDNGATQKQLQDRTKETRRQFIRVAIEMGYTKREAKRLADQYVGIPKNVKTRVSAPGLDSVSRRVARLDNALAGLPNAARMEFKMTGDGPGAVSGGSAIARMRALARGLPVFLTSSYRSPSHNASVGGSPTSYHMDRSNPAGDWGGPTWALDELHRRARAAGGWRELIWRAPGHYDHVHAAKSGGNRSGWTLVGEEGPELARLPIGTRVVPNAASRRMSGGCSGCTHLIVQGSIISEGDLLRIMRKTVRNFGGGSAQAALS